MGSEMRCTACRLPSAYNRAVVDIVREEAVGCLCTGCVESYFGESLDRYEATGEACVLCDRDGFMALPEWQALTVTTTEAIHIRGVDFTVDESTPRLCDHHLHELREKRRSASAATRSKNDSSGPGSGDS